MTREEAIEILKDLWRTKHSTYLEADIRKALEMAIQALEQEPRKDEVILTNKEYRELVSSEYENGYAKGFRDAIEQEPSGDLIQRQAVIDAVSEWLYDKTRKESIETVIKAIPSAEPKIGHWVLGICDTCGYDWGKDAPIASVPNFCPNCGCRMFEPQERSDE